MDRVANFLFWAGGAGWVLVLFATDLRGSKSVGGALLRTFIGCLILLDALASLLGMSTPFIRWADIGWKFVCFFVILPYALAFLQLRRWHTGRPKLADNPKPIE